MVFHLHLFISEHLPRHQSGDGQPVELSSLRTFSYENRKTNASHNVRKVVRTLAPRLLQIERPSARVHLFHSFCTHAKPFLPRVPNASRCHGHVTLNGNAENLAEKEFFREARSSPRAAAIFQQPARRLRALPD